MIQGEPSLHSDSKVSQGYIPCLKQIKICCGMYTECFSLSLILSIKKKIYKVNVKRQMEKKWENYFLKAETSQENGQAGLLSGIVLAEQALQPEFSN